MKCWCCRSTERIEFEFPEGIIFGSRCINKYCLAGVEIYQVDNPYVQPPFIKRKLKIEK